MGFKYQRDYIDKEVRMEEITIMVEFNLFGDNIDFKDITSSLNLEPTEIIRKEDFKIPFYAKDTWSVSTGYKQEKAISTPFEDIVSILKDKVNIINQLKIIYKMESNIVIVVNTDVNNTPEFVITNECVQFASSTNSEIHFDNYFYTEE